MFSWGKLIQPIVSFLGACVAVVAGIAYIERNGKNKADLKAAEDEIKADDEANKAKQEASEQVAKTSDDDIDNEFKRFVRDGE